MPFVPRQSVWAYWLIPWLLVALTACHGGGAGSRLVTTPSGRVLNADAYGFNGILSYWELVAGIADAPRYVVEDTQGLFFVNIGWEKLGPVGEGSLRFLSPGHLKAYPSLDYVFAWREQSLIAYGAAGVRRPALICANSVEGSQALRFILRGQFKDIQADMRSGQQAPLADLPVMLPPMGAEGELVYQIVGQGTLQIFDETRTLSRPVEAVFEPNHSAARVEKLLCAHQNGESLSQ